MKPLYYKQRNLLHVSATYCDHPQGEEDGHNRLSKHNTINLCMYKHLLVLFIRMREFSYHAKG